MVTLFISDVDGTLTDGALYLGSLGAMFMRFSKRDGMGFELLRNKGVLSAIITSEENSYAPAQLRANQIHASFFQFGVKDKVAFVQESFVPYYTNAPEGLWEEVAFIGDDINDIPLLEKVGWAFCPSDAHPKVKAVEGIHICSCSGGNGAVREAIDWILDNVLKE